MALDAPSPDQLRHQRLTALLGAALVAPFAALDLAQAGGPRRVAVALAARAAWVAALLLGAWLLSPARRRAALAEGVMGTTTVGAVVAIVGATGGTRSDYFGFLLVLPLCMQVLLPGRLLATAASGAVGIAAGGLLLERAGAPSLELLRWVGMGVAASGIAAYASGVGGALFRRELAAARARAEAADALARSERRRAASERLAVVGRLAAGVAHEINNPLGVVKANVSFALDALPRREGATAGALPELAAALSDALRGVERIRRIVADLGELSREQAAAPCGSSTGGAVGEALRFASLRTRGVEVLVDMPEGLPRVRICERRLVQVLVNLLVNAVDAVEEAAADGRRRWVRVSAEGRGRQVVIRVEDGGNGLPEGSLARLFEPFFTTKPPGRGTGLGLAVSHEYVTAAGGRIRAANGGGGGAVFEVQLPVDEGNAGLCSGCTPGAAPRPRGPDRASA